jgi:transcription elongation factor GreB
VERPRVTQAVSEAAAQGDRSENAEYTYGKKRLREIDSRVRFLRKRLDGMVVVGQPPTDRDRVFFGAWVTLEDDTGAPSLRRIVGPDEFDAAPGQISMDAPLARAMLGNSLAEQGTVELPDVGYCAFKAPVFPFQKFPGVDFVLGPEMRSTGEVMGVGITFGEAMLKSQLGAGSRLPDDWTSIRPACSC